MRGIEICQSSWECPRCNRWASLSLKKCRGCGYKYLTDENEQQAKKQAKKRTKAQEPDTGTESFITSTIKFIGEGRGGK